MNEHRWELSSQIRILRNQLNQIEQELVTNAPLNSKLYFTTIDEMKHTADQMQAFAEEIS